MKIMEIDAMNFTYAETKAYRVIEVNIGELKKGIDGRDGRDGKGCWPSIRASSRRGVSLVLRLAGTANMLA